MTDLTLGVTGSGKSITDRQKDCASELMEHWRRLGIEWQHNGDCLVADEFMGREWRKLGGRLWLHPCVLPGKPVQTYRAFLFGQAKMDNEWDVQESIKPPLERNIDIVEASSFILAMPHKDHEEQRSGTWHTVRQARKAGKAIFICWPDGKLRVE